MRRYFPYARLGADPQLTITELEVDSQRPHPYPVEDQVRTVELGRISEPADWVTAAFRLRLEMSEDELGEHPDTRVVAIASCQATNLRRSVVMERVGPGAFEVKMRLPRDRCRGRVDVLAEVTATIDGVAHRRLAESTEWQFRFDASAPLAIHGALDVRWVHFKSKDAEQPPVPPEARNESFYVDLTGGEPVVYLNLDIDGLNALLSEATSRPPFEAQLRDSELRRIATATWTSLFNVALSGIRRETDDADAEWPSEEWQVRVLKTLLPKAYPNAETAEALNSAFIELHDGDPNLQTRVQLAVSQLLGSGKALARGLEELEKATA